MWLALAALTGAIVLVLELGSRRWIRHRSRCYVWPPGQRLELRQDADVFAEVEPRARFDVNSAGERGGEVPRDEPGLFRILVAGGSAAECLALDQPTSWPGELERILDSEANRRVLGVTRVHVGNIGRSGIASRHLDLIFEKVLPQYRRLSVIVIMVGASDFLRWLEDGAPPSPPPAPTLGECFVVHPERPFGWMPRQWAIIELARRARRAWLHPIEVREDAGGWVPAARRMRAEAKEIRTDVPDAAPILQAFDHHFRRALKRARAHADRVLVVRQPWFEKDYTPEEEARLWHGGVGKAWKEKLTTYYAQNVLNQLAALIDAHAAAVSDDVGIEHLNLRPVLAPTLDHYFDMFHYTPAGAGVVARAVADALLRPVPTPEIAGARQW